MRRVVLTAIAIGAVLPLMIFAISEAQLITDTWWFNSIPFVWPSYFMLLPFSGPADRVTIGILLLSTAVNAVVYGMLGAALYWLLNKLKGPGESHSSQPHR
jgi:hypothetical protein